MGLRDTMNNNPAVVTGGAVVVLLLCLGLVYWQFSGGGGAASGTAQLVYFDTASKTIKLVPVERGQAFDSPLGDAPDAYAAQVLACGECANDKFVEGMTLEELEAAGMFIGWLEKWDPGTNRDEFNPSYQYRPFKGQNWISATSDQWYSVQDQITRSCPGGTYAQYCYPDMK